MPRRGRCRRPLAVASHSRVRCPSRGSSRRPSTPARRVSDRETWVTSRAGAWDANMSAMGGHGPTNRSGSRSRRQRTGRAVGGPALRQNRQRADLRDVHARTQPEIRLERYAPGPGWRHLITIRQLRRFIELLPDWDEVAVGLDAIVLDGGSPVTMGRFTPGVVAVCSWERGLWWYDADPGFVVEHRALLDALEVECLEQEQRLEVRWTERQARAFQLCHILPHELGHHRDCMTTR